MMDSVLGFDGAAVHELSARKAWALARLGELVNAGRAAGWLAGRPIDGVRDPAALAEEAPARSTPMRTLQAQLRLSAIEMDLLWLLVCVELEPALAGSAQLLVSPGMHELNAQILEHIVVGGDDNLGREALERLARFGLIETTLDPRIPLYRRGVRPNDRVIELARGWLALDKELRDVATLTSSLEIRRSTVKLDLALPEALTHAVDDADDVLVVATGVDGSGRATILRHATSSTGRAVLEIRASALAKDPERLSRQLRAIARECRLHDAWPLLREIDALTEHASIVERDLLCAHDGPVLATAREACTWPIERALITFSIAIPDETRRTAMWTKALPELAEDVARTCAARYAISPGLLTRTASAVSAGAGSVALDDVHTALRSQLERRLLGLAERIETRQSWEDLVLPVDQFDLLTELVARVRHRRQVLETWGFADKVGRGLG